MVNESASKGANVKSASMTAQSNTRQTGTRPRQEMRTPRWGEALEPDAPEPVEPQQRTLHPSVAPESLRAPYASLTPKKRTEEGISPPQPVVVSNIGSKLPQSELLPPSLGSKVREANATCLVHGLARGPKGRCLLCEKESPQATNDDARGWRLIVALMALALTIALALAAMK